MGVTYIEGIVTAPNGASAKERFLVDSGATYALLPEGVWRKLNLQPKRRVAFTLADGAQIDRGISACHIALPQGDGHTPVILGETGDEALLGVVALEILGLVLNTFSRTLQPMRMMLV
jgi:predicted aspartyl protease